MGHGAWRKTEDRGQRTEDRGQRTEDRGQRTEDRDPAVGAAFHDLSLSKVSRDSAISYPLKVSTIITI
jgi:hypothetical protein